MIKISIIIPTYNEKEVIEECLKSLENQSYKDFEIIVVNDGGNDLSDEELKYFKNINVLFQDHKGAGAARNLGAGKASGEILVFVDADMTFEKDFLKNLIKPILNKKAKGTFSKEEIVSNWQSPWARCWNLNEGWEDKKRHPKNYPDHQFVFRAVLKSEFERVGGFTPGGYDDDWSLGIKLGYEAVAAPGAIFYHKNPDNLKEIYNHAKWVGKRKYKLGRVGDVVALIRAFFPFSIIVGLIKSAIFLNLYFLIFKIVYDFGIFVGVLEKIFLNKSAK